MYKRQIREGDVLALTLDDFDFKKNTMKITKNYVKIGKEELIQSPKTPKSKRVITLPQEIMDMVKNYSAKLYGYSSSERLFLANKYSILRELNKICKLSGVKKIRIHDLRHPYVKPTTKKYLFFLVPMIQLS